MNTIQTIVPTSEELEKKHGMTEEKLFSRAEYNQMAGEVVTSSGYSYWRSVWQTFIRQPRVRITGVLFILLLIFSFVATAIGKYDYNSLSTNFAMMFQTPSSEFWFGTDNLGRDFWSQVWGATQTSIKLSGMVAIGTTVVGVIVGCFWGYIRALDRIFTELYNLISNLPSIIYMTLIALFIGQSLMVLTVAMIAFNFLPLAKQIRGLVFQYRDREYNLASRCLGTKTWTVIRKNLIPYLVSVIALRFALSIPGTIGMETTLSYLGLGLGIDTPSLGILLRNARTYFVAYPHLLIFPAAVVAILTISVYLLGNSFSDCCDPRNHV